MNNKDIKKLAREYYNEEVDWRADSCRDEIMEAFMAGYEKALGDNVMPRFEVD